MLSTYHPIRKVSKRNDNINSELHKNAPGKFKQGLLQFFNNILYKKCIPNEWTNAVAIPTFKKGTEEPRKTTEELVFVTPVIRGTAVAQWLRCCATNRKAAGSVPDGVIGIFH